MVSNIYCFYHFLIEIIAGSSVVLLVENTRYIVDPAILTAKPGTRDYEQFLIGT